MMKFSVLELLHPDGVARTSFVLGMNCPELLRPEPQKEAHEEMDLFILAPSAEECGSDRWLEAALQSMYHSLSADGIGYVLVPPRWRWKVMNLLNKAELITDTAFWHFPDWSSSRYLISMERNPAQYTLNAIFAVSTPKQFLVRQMFRSSGIRQFLATFWKPVALTIRRPGARPLFEWLFPSERLQPLPAGAIIRTSWRGMDGANIVYSISGDRNIPSMIAKSTSAYNSANPDREAKVLAELGGKVRQTGVQVPEVIGRQNNERRSSLLLSFIPGRSVSDLLRSNADLFITIITRVVDWLVSWHRFTVVIRPLKWDQFEQALLTPLGGLSSSIQGAEKYRGWLVTHGQGALKNPVPLVATHNDLTMSNVLLDEQNRLGVVDWETACPESLPFVDFYYAVTDAARIAGNCTDWLSAFKACFLTEGIYYAAVIAWRKQLQSAVDPPAGFAEFCFHACWLHHAFNEHRTSLPGEPRPFLDIVQWLALDESKFNHN
jgi:aminoglycoside phosphotransferase